MSPQNLYYSFEWIQIRILTIGIILRKFLIKKIKITSYFESDIKNEAFDRIYSDQYNILYVYENASFL